MKTRLFFSISILSGALCFLSPMVGASNEVSGDLVTQSPVYKMGTTETIDAMSTVSRHKHNIGFEFDARELTPGNVYTLWIMNFDKPKKCFDPCSCNLGDFTNPDVVGGAIGAMAGRVADDYGQVRMSTVIDYGTLPSGAGQILMPNAIEDKDDHIILVLRDHGKASYDPEILKSQLTSWGGGCDINGCTDVVISDHKSPFCKAKP